MRTILIVALLLLHSTAIAQPRDPWGGKDKIKHAQYSCVFGGAAALAVESKWAAVGLGILPGLAWELHGMNKPGMWFSHKDMLANLAGSYLCATGVHWALNYRRGTTMVSYSKEF